MSSVDFEWIVEESDQPGAVAELATEGATPAPQPYEPTAEEADDYGDSAFEPLTLIAATLAISALVKVVSSVVLEQRYPGGAIADVRSGKLRMRPAPFLDKGTLVVVEADGSKVFKPADRKAGMDYLEGALAALTAVG